MRTLVAEDVDLDRGRGPVGLYVSLVISPESAHHRGLGTIEHQNPALPEFDAGAVLIDDVCPNAGQRDSGGAVFERDGPGQRRDHGHARLGLPPRVDDGTAATANIRLVLVPGFWLDRFAYRT